MRISDWSSDVCSSDLSVWSFLLDGIFIGATRTAPMRNAMILSLAVFLLAVWLLVPPLGNHGLWLSLLLFLAARVVTLGLHYPALEESVGPDRTRVVSGMSVSVRIVLGVRSLINKNMCYLSITS